jgi:hypothetical protein
VPAHHIRSQFFREPFPNAQCLFFAQQGNHADRTATHLRIGGQRLYFAYDEFDFRAIDAVVAPGIADKVVLQRGIEALRTPGEPERT